MHVRSTGAVRLYIQLAPWRYNTEHFGVEFRLPSETNITPFLIRNMKSYAHSRGLAMPWVTLDIRCNSSYQDLWMTRFIRHYR